MAAMRVPWRDCPRACCKCSSRWDWRRLLPHRGRAIFDRSRPACARPFSGRSIGCCAQAQRRKFKDSFTIRTRITTKHVNLSIVNFSGLCCHGLKHFQANGRRFAFGSVNKTLEIFHVSMKREKSSSVSGLMAMRTSHILPPLRAAWVSWFMPPSHAQNLGGGLIEFLVTGGEMAPADARTAQAASATHANAPYGRDAEPAPRQRHAGLARAGGALPEEFRRSCCAAKSITPARAAGPARSSSIRPAIIFIS